MSDPKKPKPVSGWPIEPKSTVPPGSPTAPKQPAPAAESDAGRIVHDARGNAVWNWVKDTGRAAIDSTSAMLKRLEVPGLKMEGEEDKDELSIKKDRDVGGGYDPYNVRTPTPRKTPGRK